MICNQAQVIFKEKHHLLPGKLQKVFTEREGDYSFRGKYNIQTLGVRTTMTSLCLSVARVRLWNSMNLELKECTTIKQKTIRRKEENMSEMSG